jgi:hypothetical protein
MHMHAVSSVLQLIVATGKARGPWVPEVLPRLGTTLPGVFLQGLLIADKDGQILHSRCVHMPPCTMSTRDAGIYSSLCPAHPRCPHLLHCNFP